VLHLRLDEGSGTTALDSSGNGNDGAITGGTYTAEKKVGTSALRLDGSTGYVNIPDSASMDFDKTQGTIALWVKPENPAIGTYQLLAIDSGWNIEFDIHGNGDVFFYPNAKDSPWNNINTIANPLAAKQWNHVAVTWDHSTKKARMYVNGAERVPSSERVPTYWSTIATTADWHIGGRPSSGRKLNGSIDDVRIYSRAISAAEVLALYQAAPSHRADTTVPFGCISSTEVFAFLDRWKQPSTDVSMAELIDAIRLWKTGTC
jgi:hypothetical protein